MAEQTNRTHPLLLAAAASVMLFAAVGSAALLGWLPSSHGEQQATPAPAEPVAQSPAQPVVQTATPKPQPAPAKAVKTVHREPVRIARPALCTSCGTVESVREVTEAGEGSGLGAVIGGVTGGVVGRQFGGGRGKDVMTVVGVVGGGVAGHQIEKRVRAVKHYEATVRFEDGRTAVYRSDTPAWQVGDRVRLVDGSLRHRA